MLNSNHEYKLKIIEENIVNAIKKRNVGMLYKQLKKVKNKWGITALMDMIRHNINCTDNWKLNSSDVAFFNEHIRITRLNSVAVSEDGQTSFKQYTVLGGKDW